MRVVPLDIPDIKLLTIEKFGDHRGFFSETYNRRVLHDAGIDLTFVQDNHVFSASKWTLRGLHFQVPPYAQDKLLRVVRGSVLDVSVDIRRSSSTYGRHVLAVLSAKAWNQILVPIGFAHAVLTLEPNTEFIYKVTNYYSPEHAQGILWDDADLGIDWSAPTDKIELSEADKHQPLFKELQSPFV